MRTIERRTSTMRDVRVSTPASRGSGKMSGRAILYDSLSVDLGGFRERFVPGSVQLSDDLLVLFNHESGMVLGRTGAGTARAWDDGHGIAFEVEPPDTTWARDLAASMKRGDISQCSFAFQVVDDEFTYDERLQTVVRIVYAAKVSELSIVSMPAYEATQALVT